LLRLLALLSGFTTERYQAMAGYSRSDSISWADRELGQEGSMMRPKILEDDYLDNERSNLSHHSWGSWVYSVVSGSHSSSEAGDEPTDPKAAARNLNWEVENGEATGTDPQHGNVDSNSKPHELTETVVPAGCRFPIVVPAFLHVKHGNEYAFTTRAYIKEAKCPLFELKVTRPRCPRALDNTQHDGDPTPDEYVGLYLPGEPFEQAYCAFGYPDGSLNCHMFNGCTKSPMGHIRKGEEKGSFNVFTGDRQSRRAFAVKVSQNNKNSRRVSIFGHTDERTPLVVANLRGGDEKKWPQAGKSVYEVDCLPKCEVVIAVLILVGIDRMSTDVHE